MAKPLPHFCCNFHRNHYSHLDGCKLSVRWVVKVTITVSATTSTESKDAIGRSFSPNAQKPLLTVRWSREHKFVVSDFDVWCKKCGEMRPVLHPREAVPHSNEAYNRMAPLASKYSRRKIRSSSVRGIWALLRT
jgi:hypothetical protein